MKYLNTKPGSIEEVVANMSKHQNESGYQDMFKKELEKAGKGIGAMTPAEKKAFFNKIDDKYKAKNEDIKEAVDNPYAVGMAVAKKMKNDEPPLKKSTITKAHDIAKSIEKDEKNEEKDVPKGYHKMPDGTIMKDSEHKKETHTFMTKDMNKSKKDAKGEKEIVDPEPKMKQESIQDTIANVWKMSAEELEKIKTEAKYMKAQRMSQYKAEDEKNKKGTADTGSKETKVDVEPSVDYKN
jgi:alpha-acetolactate decarboxylase